MVFRTIPLFFCPADFYVRTVNKKPKCEKCVVMKTGCHPMKTQLKLFFKWGIKFESAYTVSEQAERKVLYADRAEPEREILRKFPQMAVSIEFADVFNEAVSKKRAPRTRKKAVNQKQVVEKQNNRL